MIRHSLTYAFLIPLTQMDTDDGKIDRSLSMKKRNRAVIQQYQKKPDHPKDNIAHIVAMCLCTV